MAKLVLLLVFVCFQFSKSEELSAIEQVKLDLDEDDAPFTNQTGPDTELLDGSDEEEWSPGPKFNSDWLNEKLPSEESLNGTNSNAQTILDKLIELAEMMADYSDEEYSDEDYSYDWDDDLSYWDDDDDDDDDDDEFSYWEIIKEWISNAQEKASQKNKNGKGYAYNRMISLLRPKNLGADKAGSSLNKRFHPVKRFTSV